MQLMARNIWACTIMHRVATDETPQHQFCPERTIPRVADSAMHHVHVLESPTLTMIPFQQQFSKW